MSTYSTDQQILRTGIDWINKGHKVALVTVVKTWGSSPRPIGSLLIMRDDGIHAGSVSGGCVEEDLVARYRNGELAERYPTLIDYGVDRHEAMRFGLPCGGRLELLVERLDSEIPLQAILEKMKKGELIKRRICLNTGEASLHPAVAADDFQYSSDYVQKIFGPSWHMLLIGAGHLSRYVAQIALMLNYKVTICDPRQEYQQEWDVEGTTFTAKMPDDAVTELANHPCSIVITLTHDPKLDDMALMEALQSNAFYVGALGSKRTSEKRRERLAELGLSVENIARLHAPVGLAIGSHTPPEIAVAIMAGITAARHAPNVIKQQK